MPEEDNKDQKTPTYEEALAQYKAELEEAKKVAEEAKKTAAASQDYVAGIRRAALGEEAAPADPNKQFLDDIVANKGLHTVESLTNQLIEKKMAEYMPAIDQRTYAIMQNKAVTDTILSDFEKNNPVLKPFKDEVVNMASYLINDAAKNGKTVSQEAAMKQATDHYKQKAEAALALGSAGNVPAGYGGPLGMMAYGHDGEADPFAAMTDEQFMEYDKKKSMESKQRFHRQYIPNR